MTGLVSKLAGPEVPDRIWEALTSGEEGKKGMGFKERRFNEEEGGIVRAILYF